MRDRGPGTSRVVVVAALLLLVLAATSVGLGSPALGPAQIVRAFQAPNSLAGVVVVDIRLPRVVLAVLVGTALAIAGLLLQDCLRNDLAGPELLGASSGAALAIAVLTLSALPVPWALQPVIALVGAIAGGALVLGLVGTFSSPERVAVLGAAVSSVLAAMITAVIALGGDTARVNLLFTYLLGSLSARNWTHVALVSPAVVLVVFGGALLARSVGLIRLGEAPARALGVRVTGVRVVVLVLVAFVAASVTAACGPIAFVALLAPHLARRVAGETRTARLLPLTGVLGALLLVVADRAAQLVVYPAEIPVGVMTTVVGVPVLLVLLATRRGAAARPGVE